MKEAALDILTDLVLEDLDREKPLFEANPYHDARGRFTGTVATKAYQAGFMAAGRAAGLMAKMRGADKSEVRREIIRGMLNHEGDVKKAAGHLGAKDAKKWGRWHGEKDLACVRRGGEV